MSETLPIIKPIDLSGIENPHIRIALRDLQSMLIFTLQRQQLDIQALLEMMIDHHIGSLAEFKRYLARQKENAHRSNPRRHRCRHTTPAGRAAAECAHFANKKIKQQKPSPPRPNRLRVVRWW